MVASLPSTRNTPSSHFRQKNAMVFAYFIQMPPDAPRCLPDASRCLPDASQMPPRCLQMPPDASKCFQMPPDASRCPPDVSRCSPNVFKSLQMPSDDASRYFPDASRMFPDASRCFQMLPGLDALDITPCTAAAGQSTQLLKGSSGHQLTTDCK